MVYFLCITKGILNQEQIHKEIQIKNVYEFAQKGAAEITAPLQYRKFIVPNYDVF